ncbi:MipA/OmpV family protein [Vibrio agarivorans]|uniref:MipA/OmpV family protein n=1 Tax=Vibrio agarivorans TaxID=153622 RepID=A0ABT7Y0M2_9VIBR|nr:MipA/OmpV family protein [Vibrio agarivorans]MDN2481587.1 MipA/OmpV family protein [Vibrio agarivorans]
MLYNSKNKVLLLTALAFSASASAAPSPWSVGVGASYSPEVYIDTDSNRTVIPIIGYEGDHLFLRGFSAGYRIFPRGTPHNFVLRLQYDPRTLDPDDSSDPDIKKLDKRKSAVLGGASYQYLSRYGMFEVSAGADIAGRHDGFYAQTSYSYPIRGQGWGFTPNIGYAYNSEKLNQHLYGVSAAEAARTRFNEFDPGYDGNFFIGASGYYGITRSIRVMGAIRYSNLEGDLEESPILDATHGTSLMLGITYSF